uniref:COP9 signalosome complex subunit 3 n=1 Tax=Lynceus sp. MCZ IZ 141354 TaxID=1930659 RepID=A0A9N6ZFT7_9CRUS|nr:EOG090X04TU [Lynceus sp. MCZ IZ 141354]
MASPLETFVNTVRNMSTQGNLKDLHGFLNKSSDMLVKNSSQLDTVLETLDFEAQSMGVLAVLCVKLHSGPQGNDFEILFHQVKKLIDSCNPEQLKFASDSFAEMCHMLTIGLVNNQIPFIGLELMVKAIALLQSSPTQLTSVHSDLLLLCLKSNQLKFAQKYLVDMTDVNNENGTFDSRYFLSYFCYAAHIHTALKQFERAIYCYEVCVTMPALAVSHIMLEAYKRYVLLSLMIHGKLPVLPKYTSPVVHRYVRPLAQPYLDLATAFGSNTIAPLTAAFQKHQDVFTRDANVGLVKQVIKSWYRKVIQKLTQTFMTLSLNDMATRVGLASGAEAEKLVLNMIEEGEIYATISQDDSGSGMVIFHDNPDRHDNKRTMLRLQNSVDRIIELNQLLVGMDREVSVNPVYVKKASGMIEEMENSQDRSSQGYEKISAPKITTYPL